MNKEFKTRTITTSEGVKMTIFGAKLHDWEYPAVIYPKDMKKKDEYHLYGIQYTKDNWLQARRDRNGVPPEKSGSVTVVK
jgi:hypothetical protein